MAKSLCLLLCFLVLFHCCKGRQQTSRQQKECRISRLNAQRPSNRIQSDAGITEIYDHNNQQFQCAGVAVVRYTIEPKGLLLPSYVNAPQLMYFVQGRGLQGIMITGCAETFQSFQESQQGQEQQEEGQQGQQEEQQQGQQGQQEEQQQGQQGQQGEQGQQFRGDQHQKIREVEEGDVFVVPIGVGHFIYNNGDRRLVVVSVLDTSNDANQLDFQPRRFYLAGNPQNEFQQQEQQEEEGSQGQKQQQEGGGSEGRGQESSGNNIFNGFDAQQLAEAFNVDVQLIRKLQGQNDRRGNIVRVEGGLQTVLPPRGQQERREQRSNRLHAGGNGFEETICSLRLKVNIGDPRRADVYTRRGGHTSSVTGYDLPILQETVKLSAHKGHLHQGAVMLPYYNVNAHSILYAIRGSARIQVVQHEGQNVFNEEVQQGQVLVIPQNFAALIKAGDPGFEYVAIKTDENAVINTLAGDLSLLRAMPLQVLSHAYQVSNNQARQLKYNRQEGTIAAPGSSRSEYKASA